jgi:hypothetical protein
LEHSDYKKNLGFHYELAPKKRHERKSLHRDENKSRLCFYFMGRIGLEPAARKKKGENISPLLGYLLSPFNCGLTNL